VRGEETRQGGHSAAEIKVTRYPSKKCYQKAGKSSAIQPRSWERRLHAATQPVMMSCKPQRPTRQLGGFWLPCLLAPLWQTRVLSRSFTAHQTLAIFTVAARRYDHPGLIAMLWDRNRDSSEIDGLDRRGEGRPMRRCQPRQSGALHAYPSLLQIVGMPRDPCLVSLQAVAQAV